MIINIDAIFEDGVLKPLGPVALPEHEQVQVSIHCRESLHPEDSDPEVLARQQQAINELLALARKFPCPDLGDGFSGADHDEVIYGRPA